LRVTKDSPRDIAEIRHFLVRELVSGNRYSPLCLTANANIEARKKVLAKR
jgi:hypothetical protein